MLNRHSESGKFTRRRRFRGSTAALFLLCAAGVSLAQPVIIEGDRNLTGQLLVAAPEMKDPNFSKTVIYMIEHSAGGAMGLAINRPLARGPISDLLKGLGVGSEEISGEIILHAGGPVEPRRAFVLHSDDYADKRTTVVGGGVALTTDVEIVRAIGQGKGPRQIIFILGFAGWAPGQLEAEIKAGAWFSIAADEKLIFGGDPATMWERAAARQKVKT